MEIFITPAIDMLIFAFSAYAIAYYVYIRLYKKDFAGVASVDLKLSLALIFLVSAYYYGSGVVVQIADVRVHWLAYYLVMSGLVEIVFFLLYKKATGITWKEIGEAQKK